MKWIPFWEPRLLIFIVPICLHSRYVTFFFFFLFLEWNPPLSCHITQTPVFWRWYMRLSSKCVFKGMAHGVSQLLIAKMQLSSRAPTPRSKHSPVRGSLRCHREQSEGSKPEKLNPFCEEKSPSVTKLGLHRRNLLGVKTPSCVPARTTVNEGGQAAALQHHGDREPASQPRASLNLGKDGQGAEEADEPDGVEGGRWERVDG